MNARVGSFSSTPVALPDDQMRGCHELEPHVTAVAAPVMGDVLLFLRWRPSDARRLDNRALLPLPVRRACSTNRLTLYSTSSRCRDGTHFIPAELGSGLSPMGRRQRHSWWDSTACACVGTLETPARPGPTGARGRRGPKSTLSFTPLCWLSHHCVHSRITVSSTHGRYQTCSETEKKAFQMLGVCVLGAAEATLPRAWGATRTRACLDTHCPSRRPLESTWQRLRCKGATFCTVT